jgi:hypothetical protein
MSTKKYFFISFTGTKLIDFQKMGIEEESLRENSGMVLENGKKMIPVPFASSCTIPSDSGMFVPSYLEYFIRTNFKAQEIKITFVRELSEEEFKQDQEFIKELMKDPNDRPLDKQTLNEIEKLIGTCEKGNLRVSVNPDSEKQKDEYENLFKRPSEWDE